MIWAQVANAINLIPKYTTVSCNQGNHSVVKTTNLVSPETDHHESNFEWKKVKYEQVC